jgi:Outer membrane protein beta-barrel domain
MRVTWRPSTGRDRECDELPQAIPVVKAATLREHGLIRLAQRAIALSLLAVAAVPTYASDLLGLYVGGGIGESTVRSDTGFDPDYPADSHPHHTAWKIMAGIRPIPFLGAEAEYVDFGHPDSADSYSVDGSNYYGQNADSHPKAGVLYGVGYLPLPVVPLDIFAKVGVARLETNLNTYSQPCGDCEPVLSREYAYQTKAAYGAGAQVHFFGLAVRGEYERIKSSYGDPDAFLLSATWTF